MVVGALTLEFHFPHARSLKDKRQVLKGFKDRVRARFNVSVAEVGFQDKWQRALVGVATVSGEAAFVEETLRKVLEDALGTPGAELAGHDLATY